MATRHYLTTRSHGAILPGPVRGSWDATLTGARLESLVEWAWVLSTSKVDGGVRGTITVGETNDTADYDIMIGRWATNPLDAQTITGTLNLAAVVWRSDLGSTVCYHVHAYIAVGTSNVVRHVLLDNYINSSQLWTFTQTARGLAAAQALTAGACEAGDRVVVEIGARFVSNNPADLFDTTATMYIGTLLNLTTPNPDAVLGNTSLDQAPYLDWSHTFIEQAAPAAPANDACADATLILSTPYVDGPHDTTQSTDAGKATWYRWTADSATRHFVTTLGSNHGAFIEIFTGGCGVLTPVSQLFGGELWVQRAQHIGSFVPTVGVEYLFRVRSISYSGGNAQNSGGVTMFRLFRQDQSLTPGDLFIDCQHVVKYRDGARLNAAVQFYGQTPTGSAIDYTRRPIEDNAAGGDPNTLERLYISLFGPFPVVEVIEAESMNVGLASNDTNVMTVAFDGGENLASDIFDKDGNLLAGFFGDNYSVIGTLPTDLSTGYPRRVDGVTGLDNPGPAASADVFAVALENSGAEYIDITADATVLFYTSAGRRVLRYNVSTLTQLTDFALLPVQAGVPRPGARGLRLLPPGDGTGGLLVCYGDRVLRLDSAGNVVQSYIPTPIDPFAQALNLDKIEITPDATEFWVSDQLSTTLWKFNIASGAQLQEIYTDLPTGQLSGFSIYQGYRAGTSPTVAPDLPEACPPGNLDPLPVTGTGCFPSTPGLG